MSEALLCLGSAEVPHAPARLDYLAEYAPACAQYACRVCGLRILVRTDPEAPTPSGE